MVQGIVIPAVPFLALEEREFAGLSDYQDAVGGFIEPISVSDPPLTIYVNEEGRSRNMSFNERATALWWLLEPAARGQGLIAGDAVVLVETAGNDRGLLGMLTRDHDLRVEVQVTGAPGVWLAGDQTFTSYFDAACFGLALTQRFAFVAAVRVTTD